MNALLQQSPRILLGVLVPVLRKPQSNSYMNVPISFEPRSSDVLGLQSITSSQALFSYDLPLVSQMPLLLTSLFLEQGLGHPEMPRWVLVALWLRLRGFAKVACSGTCIFFFFFPVNKGTCILISLGGRDLQRRHFQGKIKACSMLLRTWGAHLHYCISNCLICIDPPKSLGLFH